MRLAVEKTVGLSRRTEVERIVGMLEEGSLSALAVSLDKVDQKAVGGRVP